eukprot:TRINITY_DN33977_c0_g1_i1.p1 TRINITY_DN33977_c0_g1~~TRINITY_DN33977_c0_g1_i1.p1  ORF type:complete len:1124 (-),score=179.86 TRINITY_DN33977_c0_g1_i1:84-3455(-)
MTIKTTFGSNIITTNSPNTLVLFWAMALIGPYIMTNAWGNGRWVRFMAGFCAACGGTIQLFYVLEHQDTAVLRDIQDNFRLAICIANAITGAAFASFFEAVGLLALELWATYLCFTWSSVATENFGEFTHNNTATAGNEFNLWSWESIEQVNGVRWYFLYVTVAIVFVVIFMMSACCHIPKRLRQVLAALAGAVFGSHTTLQAIYIIAGLPGDPVDGLYSSNRDDWCEVTYCKLLAVTMSVLCVISLITQYYSWYISHREGREKYYPVVMGEDGHVARPFMSKLSSFNSDREEPVGWVDNLHTRPRTWVFLFLVVFFTCLFNYLFAAMIDWTESNIFLGAFYVMINAFLLWSLVEFFCITMYFHVIRLVLDLPPLPGRDFAGGLPATGRTVLAYCLLSKKAESSIDTFETALKAHLGNLDPRSRITTAVVSVTSIWPVVKCEVDCRDKGRARIRKVLLTEMAIVLQLHRQGALRSSDSRYQVLAEALRGVHHNGSAVPASTDRVGYWLVLLDMTSHLQANALEQALMSKIEEAQQHFIYLHRTCTILKKPGQYQDLIVLGATGRNTAYTYLQEDYGKFGRAAGSQCFGFSGNVGAPEEFEGRQEEWQKELDDLSARAMGDVELLQSLGSDQAERYYYTMALDSDTGCPPGSIRKLVEVSEHPDNRKFGIMNANLANDYSSGGECTWSMWRNALIEVSTVNLQRGQFWVFDRVGFYGKGLIRNDMYLERAIGVPGQVLEALPVDILSHDTVEAKLLHPGVAHEVTLYEDVARNPISGLSQSTRWMLGEVRNATYHDGAYSGFVDFCGNTYSLLTTCKKRRKPFIRWHEVPCSVSAEYLSHTGMRIFHAGAALLFLNFANAVLAQNRLFLVLDDSQGTFFSMYVLVFVVLALFIVPKGFLLLDKLPSCKCGQRCRSHGHRAASHGDEEAGAARGIYTKGVETESEEEIDVDEKKMAKLPYSRCGMIARQMFLALLEVLMSLLFFSPEMVIGVIRIVNGTKAQITGFSGWKPQDLVEKEVDEKVAGTGGFWYVFQSRLTIFLVGVATLAYLLYSQIYNPLLLMVVFTWIVDPLFTYWMCLPFPESCKGSWLWVWVMNLKAGQLQEMEALEEFDEDDEDDSEEDDDD